MTGETWDGSAEPFRRQKPSGRLNSRPQRLCLYCSAGFGGAVLTRSRLGLPRFAPDVAGARTHYSPQGPPVSSRSRMLHGAPGQLHHPLPLEVAQHPGHHLPMAVPRWLPMISWVSFSALRPLERCSPPAGSRATRLSRLFHMTCSISHMTSENRLAIDLVGEVGTPAPTPP